MKFHDGTTLDADAVKFSIDRVKTINKGPAVFIRGISGVEVADKSTVRCASRRTRGSRSRASR